MRYLFWIGLLSVAAAGCASSSPEARQQSEQAEAARQEAIDKILSEPLAADEYAQQERCLSTRTYRSVEVLDDRHVLFEGTGDRAWVNELRNRCIGLRPNETLAFKLRDNRVCDLDTFEAIDTSFLFVTRTSATCSLGRFTRVTPEQVEAIKAAFRDQAGS